MRDKIRKALDGFYQVTPSVRIRYKYLYPILVVTLAATLLSIKGTIDSAGKVLGPSMNVHQFVVYFAVLMSVGGLTGYISSKLKGKVKKIVAFTLGWLIFLGLCYVMSHAFGWNQWGAPASNNWIGK